MHFIRVDFVVLLFTFFLTISSAQANYVQAVTDLNPISYWRLGETTPVTSDTAVDRMGANAGTYNGAMTNVSGPLISNRDTAVVLDGVDDHVSMANESNFDFERTDSWTIIVWVKTTTTANSRIAGKLATSRGYDVGINGGQVQIQVTQSSSNLAVERTNATFNDGQWHMIAWTYNGNNSITGSLIYVDGELQATSGVSNTLAPTTTILTDVPFTLGRRAEGNLQPFAGAVDEVAVFNRVLDSQTIALLYEAAFIPEPTVASLLMLGLPLLGLRRRRC